MRISPWRRWLPLPCSRPESSASWPSESSRPASWPASALPLTAAQRQLVAALLCLTLLAAGKAAEAQTRTLSLRAPGSLSAEEGQDGTRDVGFSVRLSPAGLKRVGFNLNLTGTATYGEDYVLIVDGKEQAKQQNNKFNYNDSLTGGIGLASYVLRVSGDQDVEEDETVVVTLTSRGKATPGDVVFGTTTFTYRITNDDVPPPVRISFTKSTASLREGDTLDVAVTLSRAMTQDLIVRVALTGLTATASGVDFGSGINSETVSFTAGQKQRTFKVPTTDDATVEEDETFRLTIVTFGLPAGVERGTPHTQSVTILDDDGAPENLTLRRVAGSPASLAEGKGPAEFEIAAGRGFIKDTLGVNLKAGGTAESPYYSSGRDWRMAIRIDGEWYAVTPHPRNPFSIFSLPTRLRVWAEADKVEEENETVTLTLRAGSGYTLGTSTSVSLTITDVPPPGIVLPAADVTVDEGATASYNLKLASDPGAGATVRVSITSGDTGAVTVNDTQSGVNGAQNYLDFTGGSGGSWNTHQAVTVRGVQDADTTNEADVTLTHAVSVQAGSSTPYTGLANRTLNVDVTDDDTLPPATPVVSITGSPSSMTEGDTATFTLTASPAPTQDISVQVEVTDSGDFASGGAGPQTVTVNTSGTAVFTVVTTDDETDEPNGTITAT
ncbi:MAG: hypothetical protein F4025_03630, partial [Synechococcus sp. SB0669_bin_7]|nr:hypothetical protein [Synechococcus sp. SB0669_bin_7]